MIREDAHMTSQKVSNFQDPFPLSIYIKRFSTPLNKLWNDNRIVHMSKRKNKAKSHPIQINHKFDCLIYSTNKAKVSLNNGLLPETGVNKKISCQQYAYVWLSMMSNNILFLP